MTRAGFIVDVQRGRSHGNSGGRHTIFFGSGQEGMLIIFGGDHRLSRRRGVSLWLRGVAEDNLRLGRTVVTDSVNPLTITRDAWLDVAKRAGVIAMEVEVTCSDVKDHRRRVEARITDIAGLNLPEWSEGGLSRVPSLGARIMW